MAKVKHLKVQITKDKMHTLTVTVPQWEAQVLLAMWEEDASAVGEVFIDREPRDVNDEFTRLAQKYGPKDDDTPYVARVFGSFGPGLRSLEQEMRISISNDASTAEVTAPASRPVNGGVAPGPQLPGSDETFGEDATPQIRDDVSALAGNTIRIGDDVMSAEEFADLTGGEAE